MSKPEDIVLFVPDGVGIRNYLYADVFKNRKANLHLYHNFDPDTLDRLKSELSFTSDHEIPAYSESIKEKYYRELIHYCRLKLNTERTENSTIMHLWNKPRKGFKQKLFYGFVTFMGNFYSNYKAVLKLEKRYQSEIRSNPIYQEVSAQLAALNAQTLFCTHQRALKAPPIFAAAQDLGLKTATVIYSWDNIPKARLALQADIYLVWSAYMKEQLLAFYPELDPEQIKTTGTPQFEAYKDPKNIIPKEVFYEQYRLDPAKKIICFSGDDEYTSPYDPTYLHDFAAQLQESGLESKYQILFRRCPVDVSGRYDDVVAKFEGLIIEAPPLWNFNSNVWSAVYPTQDDVKLLVSVAHYSDMVVNLGSTMAFDFGMFGKPCIYINYDPPKATGWSVNMIYNFEHFKSMPDPAAVFWWESPESLPELLQSIPRRKSKIGDWMDIVIEDTAASDRIYEALING
ncbi:hypothetical protein [Gilvibacter sediminis]|uniref:hypothetical protein n=1 Tax=Gilvibacter sediminis TaxID=379071 RepID=UPI002350DD35|nr:hypothetical protein [Gilvibacter sediminis]MDC7999251.1 hypothetical protein [Gilvibacter sediminis]